MKGSPRPKAKKLDSLMITILAIVIMAFLVRFFILDAAIVEGKSMLPYYRNGEVVLIMKAAYGIRSLEGNYWMRWRQPAAGEVVAALSPSSHEIIIKRIGEVRRQGEEFTYFLIGYNPIESIDSRDFGLIPFDSIIGKVIPQR
ncbi:MAG: signal peptidase I [Spirochaetes bacterium ADurb.Bin110]|nr:MAG: signal peptidase I [Spirochaetes bacterium ADurb.Bin110]